MTERRLFVVPNTTGENSERTKPKLDEEILAELTLLVDTRQGLEERVDVLNGEIDALIAKHGTEYLDKIYEVHGGAPPAISTDHLEVSIHLRGIE